MIIKAKENKRRLTPGVHLVSIKDIYIARGRDSMSLPLEFTDKQTGEKYGAIEILFMDKDSVGIKNQFLLGDKHLWILDKLIRAAGLPTGEPINKEVAVGRKVWIVIARCILYENQIMRIENNEPAWFPKMLPDFFPGDLERPMLMGNPQDNEGKCGPDFTIHKDNVLGIFTPTPIYVSQYNLPTEGFGTF